MVFKVYEIVLILCCKNFKEYLEIVVILQYIGWYSKSRKYFQDVMDMFILCFGEYFMIVQCYKVIVDFYFGLFFYERDNIDMEKCFEYYGVVLILMRNFGVGYYKESILILKNYGVCCKNKGNF